jgi:hypothetical protein
MGVDRSDDFDVPSSSDHGASGDGPSGDGGPDGRVQVEARDRFEYYDSLRTAVSWEAAAERFRGEWVSHEARWPAEARKQADRSGDPEGSWRGDSGRFLDSAANADVEERCDRIAEAERNVVTPAMREIEACDPERRLVGFEHRLKGLERIKDKVAADMHLKARPVEYALANVKDTVRYTFQYSDADYSEGVRADIERLKGHGFQQVELRNSWAEDRYKGINSRWRDSGTGLLCEVQFHTPTSFEAKQLTHGAYERLRNPTTTDAEREELEGLQQRVCRNVRVPSGATDILNFP